MTWQEMIENAHLDALGLLDEQDRERFDSAFLKLPADLKTQLRAEQDRRGGSGGDAHPRTGLGEARRVLCRW